MPIKTLNYNVSFEVTGDLIAAAENLERRFPGTQMDYGKAILRITGMKRLPSGKPKSDDLNLRRLAGMSEAVLPPPKDRWLPREEFVGLGNAIRSAVFARFGKSYLLIDFSPSEVVLARNDIAGDEFWKITYKVADGEIAFIGDLVSVKKVIDYI